MIGPRELPPKPQNKENTQKLSFPGFKPGFDILRPRAVDPRWRIPDLSIFGDRQIWVPRSAIFRQIPNPIQAFPYIGRPGMPSRQQIAGRSSVRTWFKAVERLSGSQSSHFPGFGEHRKHPILPYAIVCKASEPDLRRGKPSKPRPAKHAEPTICVNQA